MPHPDQRISDPERIRALAHPVRLELLDFLGTVEDATATQCAEHTGESVASCSFHLRMLAKYGYIERAESRGREKPWRVVAGGYDLRPGADQPGSVTAVAEVAALHVLRETERVRAYLADLSSETLDWMNASTVTSGSFWATAEETAQYSEDLRRLNERFAGRSDDPALRPEGARQVRMFAAVNPDPTAPDPKGQ
ncbi:winged helix-turn-helix domain-containing protein [Ornithinimicrobium sp. F0845]|uniref:ArsR/SmtB family transcription factor n=1 Tax=Ornithinimicrobium sp. F0845 TaxID=2926412 RepID=UPI001FF3E438|nr:winged helix-turn-helix domain-containing protein [Ornithinimicrobium sp. F0845]MCK0111601.1 winged helix-turn-helix domain-containing protein [Ornithinimicrobium sp. F0845]